MPQVQSSVSSLLEVALAYGRAKSEQDLARAAQCVTEDFELRMPVLGGHSQGRAGFVTAMQRFYVSFPDYRFVCEQSVGDHNSAVMSGRMTATFSGHAVGPGTFGLGLLRGLGLVGRREIDVPAVAVFAGRDGLLAHETFHVDGLELCSAMGVSPTMLGRLRRANVAKGPTR